MFRAIRNWLRQRRAQRERLLYEVFDGERFKKLDPWAVHRALMGAPDFSLQEQLPAALQQEPDALNRARKAICDAFQVEPFDAKTGGGLLDVELFKMLSDFLTYCDALEKKTLGFATSSPRTEVRASTGRDFLDRVTS